MTGDDLEGALRAFQESRILLTAIELDVFTSIGGGATAVEVAERLKLAARATGMLLNSLVAIGLLSKDQGVYRNLPLAARLLDRNSPESAHGSMMHMVSRWHTWSTLTDRVRGITPPEDYRSLESPRHEALLAQLDRRSRGRAPKFIQILGLEGVRRVLDIGGGSAAYSIAFAQASPQLYADVFDLPEVVPITRQYIEGASATDRVRAVGGDFLRDEFGTGYDLALLFSITHLLGEEQNRSLLKRCYAALTPGGRLAIHDHLLEADKTSPREGTVFALNMLVSTAEGGTYSYDEYVDWLSAAGFRTIVRERLGSAPTSLLIATR